MNKHYADHLLSIEDEKAYLQRLRNSVYDVAARIYDEIYEYVCCIEICQNKSVVIPIIKISKSAYEYNMRCDRIPYVSQELTRSEFEICKKIFKYIEGDKDDQSIEKMDDKE